MFVFTKKSVYSALGQTDTFTLKTRTLFFCYIYNVRIYHTLFINTKGEDIMPYYEVHYKLHGAIRVEAESLEQAIRRVKGEINPKEDVSDEDLILGIEGYKPNSPYPSIDYDAIEVVEVKEASEEDM